MVDLLTEFGLIDLFRHFFQHLWFWDLKTWIKIRQGTVLCSQRDYILGKDRRRYELIRIREIQNYASAHFVLLARILQRPTWYRAYYLWGRQSLPLTLLPAAEIIEVNTKSRPSRPWSQLLPPEAPLFPPMDVSTIRLVG